MIERSCNLLRAAQNQSDGSGIKLHQASYVVKWWQHGIVLVADRIIRRIFYGDWIDDVTLIENAARIRYGVSYNKRVTIIFRRPCNGSIAVRSGHFVRPCTGSIAVR